MFKWIIGRHESGYDKMSLGGSERFKFDFWLIRYRVGSFIPIHTDPVDNHRHYRINFIIKKSKAGGEFHADKVIFQKWRLIIFRPDLTRHYVTKVTEGTRYVLSFGFARKGE